MSKILLFAGSNSSTSINKQLIQYTAGLFENAETEVILLEDFEPPMFSEDLEKEIGTHPKIKALVEKIEAADAIVASSPEHNGTPPAFFKNILDWLSRVQKIRGEGPQYLHQTKLLVMSTSNGRGGAGKAREVAKKILGYADPSVILEFELPQFKENFKEGKITNEQFDNELNSLVKQLEREG